MARFRLRKRANLKQLGRLIFEAAAANRNARGKLSAQDMTSFQQRIEKLVESADAKKIRLVFDGPREINIVVPWIGASSYSGDEFADESLGLIVFCGCAS